MSEVTVTTANTVNLYPATKKWSWGHLWIWILLIIVSNLITASYIMTVKSERRNNETISEPSHVSIAWEQYYTSGKIHNSTCRYFKKEKPQNCAYCKGIEQ